MGVTRDLSAETAGRVGSGTSDFVDGWMDGWDGVNERGLLANDEERERERRYKMEWVGRM